MGKSIHEPRFFSIIQYMKIARLTISNIMGIDFLEFEPKRFNVITGDNGKGKTSVLEAIKAAIGKGSDATILRRGAKEGQIVLEFDDGTTVTKTVGPVKSKLDITGTNKPATYLDSIRDLTSVNPIEFLLADDEKRMEMLLKAVKFDFDWDAFERTIGGLQTKRKNPLDEIAYYEKIYTEERRQGKRDRDKAQSAADELERSLPHEDIVLPEVSDLEKDLESVKAVFAEANKVAEQAYQKYKKNSEDARDALIEKARRDCELEIKEVQSKRDKYIVGAQEAYRIDSEPLQTRIGALRQQREQSAAISAQRAIVAKNRKEVELLEHDIAVSDKVVKSLESLRMKLLKNIPIPGIDIREGHIWYKSEDQDEYVPWERLNEARRTLIAMEVAAWRRGELGLMCVDGLEHLSSSTFSAFMESTKKYPDIQYFVSEVTSGYEEANAEGDVIYHPSPLEITATD